MEVVSSDDRRRDLETKRHEYARAGILEYWIVDPGDALIQVLNLDGELYRVAGQYRPGEAAKSVILSGFEVGVTEALAAGKK